MTTISTFEAAAHERLRGDQADEKPRPRNLPDRLEALPDLRRAPLVVGSDAPLDRDPRQQCRARRGGPQRPRRRPPRRWQLRRAPRQRAVRAGCRGSRSSTWLRWRRSAPAPCAPVTEGARSAPAGTASSRRRPPSRQRRRCSAFAHQRRRRPRRRAPAAPSSTRRAENARAGSDRRATRRTARSRPPGAGATGRRRRRPQSHRGRRRNTPSATKCAHSADIRRAPRQLGAANVHVPSSDVERAERLARARREEAQPDAESGRDARISEPAIHHATLTQPR